MDIGFIGLGNMGSRMASRLAAAGNRLIVRDLDPAAMQRLTDQGALPAESVTEVANRAQLILCSLPTPAAVDAVLTGEDGIVHGSVVKVVVDLSTTGTTKSVQMGKALAARGISLLDAPVSGGTMGAESGSLAIMASGAPSAYSMAEPLLKIIGKNIFYLGAEPGLGQTMKLVNNMLAAACMIASFEVLVMGAKAGLDAKTMLDVLNVSTGRNGATLEKIPQCILNRNFPMRFATELLYKDVKLGVEEAENLGATLWVTSAAKQFLTFAVTQGGGPLDTGRMIHHFERWANAEFGAR